MMLGYQLIDLLLFDLEVLQSQITFFNGRFWGWSYVALGLSTIAIFFIDRPLVRKGFYLFPATGWFFSGYFFYFSQFTSIYPPSKYISFFCIALSVLIVANAFTSHSERAMSPLKRFFVALSIVGPTMPSLFLGVSHLLTAGTSSFAAALLSIALYYDKKDLIGRIAVIFSALWVLLLASVLAELM